MSVCAINHKAARLFRRHVSESANHHPRSRFDDHFCRGCVNFLSDVVIAKPKSRTFHTIATQHDVLRFDITMHDSRLRGSSDGQAT